LQYRELEREAFKLFPRPDKLRLYMTTSDPELPGLVSPTVYTKDEQTMRQCLVLLRRRYGSASVGMRQSKLENFHFMAHQCITIFEIWHAVRVVELAIKERQLS
jgi:hypothetical protein